MQNVVKIRFSAKVALIANMAYLVEYRTAYDRNSLEWEVFYSGEVTLIGRGGSTK